MPTWLDLTIKPESLEKRDKKKRIARSSRAKGNRGESVVSDIFDNWIEVPQAFSPSSSSGANRLIGQAGDLVGPNGFIFCVEIKNDEGWRLTDFLIPGIIRKHPARIWIFWAQAVTACNKYNSKRKEHQVNKIPVLIFTKNYEDVLIMIDEVDYKNHNLRVPENFIRLINMDFGIFFICKLEDFLKCHTPLQLGIERA